MSTLGPRNNYDSTGYDTDGFAYRAASGSSALSLAYGNAPFLRCTSYPAICFWFILGPRNNYDSAGFDIGGLTHRGALTTFCTSPVTSRSASCSPSAPLVGRDVPATGTSIEGRETSQDLPMQVLTTFNHKDQ